MEHFRILCVYTFQRFAVGQTFLDKVAIFIMDMTQPPAEKGMKRLRGIGIKQIYYCGSICFARKIDCNLCHLWQLDLDGVFFDGVLFIQYSVPP